MARRITVAGPDAGKDIATETWWTGLMVKTKDNYKDKDGKPVKLIPELREVPDLTKEARFRVMYTRRDGKQEDRDDRLRSKGFMPLSEAPDEIKELAKIMKDYHQGIRLSSDREVYTPKETPVKK